MPAGPASRSYDPEHLIGYLDELSVRPGDVLHAKVSGTPASVDVGLVRCAGPALTEVPGASTAMFTAREQPVRPGSYALVEHFPAVTDLQLTIEFYPTRSADGTLHSTQALIGTWDRGAGLGWALTLERGLLTLHLAGYQCQLATPVTRWRWHRARASYLASTGSAALQLASLPDSAVTELPLTTAGECPLPSGLLAGGTARPLVMAAMLERGTATAHFDGKIANPRIGSDIPGEFLAAWDFSRSQDGDLVIDTGPRHLHGTLVQQPARAVTGSRWDGSVHCWRENPAHYDAIHFHADDLIDAGWATDVSYPLPAGMPAGIYGLRLQTAAHQDVIPFYVRAPANSRRAAVCFLASTATYLAYGNQRLDRGGFAGLATQPPDQPAGHRWASAHPEAGPSLYEPHADGSGTCYASRHRPIADWRPGSAAWGFQADLSISGWLGDNWPGFDVLTDEDLHQDGCDALAGYRVLVTGAHPEYWSTTMLNALEQWLDRGGRLMYLGGNGFYWRIAYHPRRPGIIEVRRAEDGTRAWISDPGEYYHSFTGELGGLWRRLGRPPNRLVGVGFTAQGFGPGRAYRIQPGVARDPRTAWIFNGLEHLDLLGRLGAGEAGCAAAEIDRRDVRLGSPVHSVVLASAAGFDDRMLRVKEECFATGAPPRDDGVRCDLTFFETAGGGAVFATGSLAWSDGLAERNSDVSVLTRNVLLRFVSEEPFQRPASAAAAIR
jgi:N,N-dimethylformamidase